MTKDELTRIYRDYIACLNRRDFAALDRFVHESVSHNGRQLGVSGYRKMLEKDFDEIPDLHFNTELLIADPPYVASRLIFNCTPEASFLNLGIGGVRVSFAENVFYEFVEQKIACVWSVIDKAAIEAQLSTHGGRGDASQEAPPK